MKSSLAMLLFSSTVLLADNAPSLPLQSACGPDQIKFSVKSVGRESNLPEPEPGKALVFVIFDHIPTDVGRPTVRVGLDGTWVGANRGLSHFSFPVEPGDHHFCVDWQRSGLPIHPVTAAASQLTVEPAKTYYFRARILEGVWTLDFDLLNSDQGRLLVAHTSRAEFHQKK
ncbi:MAG TPA: hypothetical protein VLX60_06130 [Terriglobales bacterium]|nr:hypothetical protein [Terriglobales bacterium]